MSEQTLPRFEPLGKHHNRAAFSSHGHPEFELFVRQFALQQTRRGLGVTHVLLVDDETTIVGYHSLSSTRLDLGELPNDLSKKFPSYEEGVPATLIGRLVVDDRWRGKGYGKWLLIDALERVHRSSAEIGSAFVLVRAKDDTAVRFYQKYGFTPLPDDPRRLFLPMKTVADLILQ